MGTLSIAVCDNDLLFAHQTKEEIKRILNHHHVEYDISLFQAGSSLLEAGFFDIVFLDIQMEGLDGLETARQFRIKGYDSHIVFLTAHKQYVFAAFDVYATHYLLKPLDTQKLEQVLMGICQKQTQEKEYCCTVKCGTQIHRIPFSQIKFAEVFGRKISLHTSQDIFTFNGRLDELAEAFPDCFFRCHKSYLINLSMVIRYNRETASLKSGEQIPIARRKFPDFGTAFLAFLEKEGETTWIS